MRKMIVLFLCMGILFVVSIFAMNPDENKQEEEKITEMIQNSLVDGYLNDYDLVQMEKGIHPDFSIMELQGNELSKRGYQELVDYVNRVKPDRPEGRRVRVSIKILSVDIVDNIGCVKVEFYVGTDLHGTDFITLIRFKEGWKLVSSVACEHE